MKIIFKDVGQGDSIIIELNRNDGYNLGIIDCKKYNGTNPVLQYLMENNVKSILFVILSHPHKDHYSGLLELLDFCEKEDISIKYFAHTANVNPVYFRWFEVDNNATLLAKIIIKSIELLDNKLIKHIGYSYKDWSLSLGSDSDMISLSPSDEELRRYYKQVKLYKNISPKKCSEAANLLSTVLKITHKNSYILLTSDAEKTTFERLHTTCMDDYLNGKLTLCQIPHHGSLKNHYAHFWNDLNRSVNCPAVVSVGEHGSYNHPEIQVVESFEQMNYKVHSTNHVNGMADFMLQIKEQTLIGRFEAHDEFLEDDYVEGDQTFTFTEGRVQEVI